jgi:plastocyanin
MRRAATQLLFASLTGAAAFASVCAFAQDAAVSIKSFKFTPAELVVPLGATVQWTNDDDSPHTVTATDKSFRSPPLDTGDQFSFTFTKAGSYAYFCSLHPQMTATIRVTPP